MDVYGSGATGDADATATLEVLPRDCLQGTKVDVRGEGWHGWSVGLTVDGRPAHVARVPLGLAGPEGILPDGSGAFVVQVSTWRLPPGNHTVTATSSHESRQITVRNTLVIRAHENPFPPDPHGHPADLREGAEAEELEDPIGRDRYFFERRFGHIERVPLGVRARQIEEIRALRARRDLLETGPAAMSQERTGRPTGRPRCRAQRTGRPWALGRSCCPAIRTAAGRSPSPSTPRTRAPCTWARPGAGCGRAPTGG